ncbi:hypothetical protein ACIQ6V_15495 [Streptomyces sp. NPDC096198]|uniref:hypothetical protein n=1 Tax=Streptomyces sp. NPDC096198 TaxID=3366080 RepID=UPI003824C27A
MMASESVATKVLRDAIERIKWHEYQWRMKGSGPDHQELLRTLLGEFQAQTQAGLGGDRPYTVVMDWAEDYYDDDAERMVFGVPDPVIFHVWAASANDASDAADAKAVEQLGESEASYLTHTAILHGHAPVVRDGE